MVLMNDFSPEETEQDESFALYEGEPLSVILDRLMNEDEDHELSGLFP